MSRLDELVRQAVHVHQNGDLAAAERMYSAILSEDASNFDALHLLGVIKRQRGQPEQALRWIDAALAIDAKHAIAHSNRGAALQDLGRIREALESYSLALQLKPDYVLAWANHAANLNRLGRHQEALASTTQVLRRDDQNVAGWTQRGIALLGLSEYEESLICFEQVLASQANNAEAWSHRANSLQMLGHFAEALDSCDRALALRPDFAEAASNRGQLLYRMSEFETSAQAYREALVMRPKHPANHSGLGDALAALGQLEAAGLAYRNALEYGANPASIEYALAALGLADAPVASPRDYVRDLFDRYAQTFDEHLLQGLEYRTPQLLLSPMIEKVADKSVDVLDLGCGTGLCAPLLSRCASSLLGVDLSPAMLERAQQQALYDSLHCADLLEFLSAAELEFDWVIAADVLVYLGALDALFQLVKLRLRDGGRFALSIEDLDAGQVTSGGKDFQLQATRRYAHSINYVNRLASEHGFFVARMEKAILRRDGDAAIYGVLFELNVAFTPT